MHAIRMLGAMLPSPAPPARPACRRRTERGDAGRPGRFVGRPANHRPLQRGDCRSAAKDDAVAIETSLTEPIRGDAGGARTATLSVKIDYLRAGGIEPRSAVIVCTVAADGQVSVELEQG